jgi:hypothetical protein
MFKQLIMIVALLCAGFAPASPALAQDMWQDGAAFLYDTKASGGCGLQGGGYIAINMKATKTIDRQNRTRSAEIELFIKTGNPGGVTTLIGPTVVQVPIDVDYLSVSRDLGWAGVDASVPLYDAATQATIMVDIHFQWFANAGVTQDGAGYKRGAYPSGTLGLKGGGYNFSQHTNPCGRTAFIFSSREPRPRY